MGEEDVPRTDDLVYAGRERKRPPGASALVQRIYGLLYDHPEGMTRDEIWEQLRDGWMETDAYRAYAAYLSSRSKVSNHGASGKRLIRGRPVADYGSDLFHTHAQKWWINRALISMWRCGSTRREGPRGASRYFAGRPPRIIGIRSTYEVLDVRTQRAAHRAETQTHLRREEAKGRLLELLHDGRIKDRTREAIQFAFDVLSGR